MKLSTKKTQSTRINPWLIAVIIAVIVAGLAYGAVWYLDSRADNNSETSDTSSLEDVPTPAPEKLDDVEAQQKKDYVENQNKQDTTNNDSQADPSSASLKLEVSQNESGVVITSKLAGIGNGDCSLNITNGTKNYTDKVGVIYQPSYSTCAGFSIPTTELGKGTWNISVTATSLDGTVAEATKSFEVS